MSRTFSIGCVYRTPPSTANKLTVPAFLEEFDSFLDTINALPGKIMLVGDFNVHWNKPTHSDVRRFMTIVSSFGFNQHVDKPTHRFGNTLDLVLTRPEDNLIHGCDVDDIRFTIDHFMVNCVLNVPTYSG